MRLINALCRFVEMIDQRGVQVGARERGLRLSNRRFEGAEIPDTHGATGHLQKSSV
jgi:hypothetical protein